MNIQNHLLIFFLFFVANSAYAQKATLIVQTSHPDVTILVDHRFPGQKNTRTHNFVWTPTHANVIYRVEVQATFKGDIKRQTVDIKCGKTVLIGFDFPVSKPPSKPVLPFPNKERIVRIIHDPIEIKTKPLEITGPLRVEPLKIELEPLVITVKNETGGIVKAVEGDPVPEVIWDLQIITMIFLGFSFIVAALIVSRAMTIQAKVHSKLIEIIRCGSQPNPSHHHSVPQTPRQPPAGNVEIEV